MPAVLFAVAVSVPKFLEMKVEYMDGGDDPFIAPTELRLNPTYQLVVSWVSFVLVRLMPFVLVAGLGVAILMLKMGQNRSPKASTGYRLQEDILFVSFPASFSN